MHLPPTGIFPFRSSRSSNRRWSLRIPQRRSSRFPRRWLCRPWRLDKTTEVISTACTSLPLHNDSPHTCQSTVNVHNNRQLDSAHFIVSMQNDSQTSPSLVHLCNDRPTDSIHVVPYVDTLGSSQCHTRHLSTGRSGNTL